MEGGRGEREREERRRDLLALYYYYYIIIIISFLQEIFRQLAISGEEKFQVT